MENNNKGHKGIILGIFLLLLLIVIMFAIKNFSYLLLDKEIHRKTLEAKFDSTAVPHSEGISLPKITILRKSGIPAVLYWNNPEWMPDENANKGSSLTREWIVLNDASCPVQLSNSVGIKTAKLSGDMGFHPTGNLKASEPIIAYEVHHVLYNVFAEHLETLSNLKIADINGSAEMNERDLWYANNNTLRAYFICVSYVANVKTKAGVIWRYNYLAIKLELNKVQIAYEENYRPEIENAKK